MKKLQISSNPEVAEVFNAYPAKVKKRMTALRKLILDTAREIDGIHHLEETLKWGEPSYLAKNGSTLRMDWKSRSPDQYALYFKCTSRLVDTFRSIYGDRLKFEGNRAIVFRMDENIPKTEIRECIKATLTYHQVKHLPGLGISDR